MDSLIIYHLGGGSEGCVEVKEGKKAERNRKSALFSLLCLMLSFPATSCACKIFNLPGTEGYQKGKLNFILGLKKFFVVGKTFLMSSCSFLCSSETLGPALKDSIDVSIFRGLTGKCLLPHWQE